VGKVCLADAAFQSLWNVAFQVTSRGFITQTLTAGERALTIAFDFISQLPSMLDGGLEALRSSRGRS
jgi:hypothetical protein